MVISNSYENKGDRYLTNFICGYLLIQAVHNLLAALGRNGTVWYVFSRGVLAILLLFALTAILRRRPIQSVLIELIFSICMLYSYFYRDIGSNFSSITFNLLLVYLPMGLACAAINDGTILLKKLYYVSWPIEIICILGGILGGARGVISSYSQSLGYLALLPLLIHLDHYLEQRKWYDIVAAIVDFLFIVVFASRGPIVCVAAFIILSIAFYPNINKKRKISLIIAILIIAIILFVNLFTFTNKLAAVLSKVGRVSRTLRLLSEGSLGYTAHRNTIYDYYIAKILENPVLGYGLAASWNVSSYPHNIFIEILLAFGIPFGGFIIILLVLFAFRGIRQNDSINRRLSIIFLCELISLLWSGSFIMSSTFFVGIALFVKGLFRYKNLMKRV